MAYTSVVVSTGGGAVLKRLNWGYMQHAVVVWLHGPPDLLAHRAMKDNAGQRPLLVADAHNEVSTTLVGNLRSPDWAARLMDQEFLAESLGNSLILVLQHHKSHCHHCTSGQVSVFDQQPVAMTVLRQTTDSSDLQSDPLHFSFCLIAEYESRLCLTGTD